MLPGGVGRPTRSKAGGRHSPVSRSTSSANSGVGGLASGRSATCAMANDDASENEDADTKVNALDTQGLWARLPPSSLSYPGGGARFAPYFFSFLSTSGAHRLRQRHVCSAGGSSFSEPMLRGIPSGLCFRFRLSSPFVRASEPTGHLLSMVSLLSLFLLCAHSAGYHRHEQGRRRKCSQLVRIDECPWPRLLQI